jgi:ribonucrease Y
LVAGRPGGVSLIGFLCLLLGVLIGLAGATAVGWVRARTARSEAGQILAAARLEADTVRKQAELDAKEEVLKRREDFEVEIDRARGDFREQERRLDKRADILDQKLELINAKEVELANAGRSLADQHEDVRRRQAEVKQTLSIQMENLQRISHLSPDEAREMLLKRVEEDLSHEIGGLVLKHQAQIQ